MGGEMRLKNDVAETNEVKFSRRNSSRPVRSADSRWLALIILCTGFLMIVLDQTIVNVALPSIKSDLGFSQAGLAWVVNAYLIAYGGLLLLAGRLGDLVGRKRIFLIGLAMFTSASLLCGLSISQPMLVAARFIQGIGGAVSTAVILGMVVTMFPEPGERARAIGVFSFVASAGASIGLLAGGLITQAVSWHWIFFVDLPIGVAIAGVASPLVESAMAAAMFGFFFLGSLDLQRVLRYGPLAIGLAFLPVALGMGGLSLGVSARLILRFGAHRVLLAGLALITVALGLVAAGPVHDEYLRDLFVPMALLGIGAGPAFPAPA